MKKARMVVACLAVVVGFAFYAGSASAADWHLSNLDGVASQVAGHSVNVYCESSNAEWVDIDRAFGDNGDGLLGFTWPGAAPDPFGNYNTVYLNPQGCEAFQVFAANGWGKNGAANDTGLYWLAGAMLTLVHEATHQYAPAWSEGQVECSAYRAMPTATATLFGIKSKISVKVRVRVNGKLRTRMKLVPNPTYQRLLAWSTFWHQSTPPEYQAVC